MKIINNERGFIKTIFWFAVLVALVFLAMSFGKPYYRYYVLGSHTRDILKNEIGNLEVIKQNIMKDADELGVPLLEGDLSVTMNLKVVKVRARWEETVDLYGYYQKKMDFVLEEEY